MLPDMYIHLKTRIYCLLIETNFKFWQFWPTQFFVIVLLLNEEVSELNNLGDFPIPYTQKNIS
jgi:hypothetical protein